MPESSANTAARWSSFAWWLDVGVTPERLAPMVRPVRLEKYVRPPVPRRIIWRFPNASRFAALWKQS